MIGVINALAPVFVLILIGYMLKRRQWVEDAFWAPAERITYRVFFPALLIASGARADLSGGAAWDMGVTLFLATLGSAALALILKPILKLEPASFTSFFQGTIRPNTYVGALVMGLPLEMDGTEGARCQSTRDFTRNLLARPGNADMPITFWDERLSTSAVERMLVDDVDMTRKRRGEVIDKLAATYILQGALDAIAFQNRN